MANPKINYGSKNHIDPEDFIPKNIKMRITTFVDLDIVDWLRKSAKKTGGGYQTLLNQILRSAMENGIAKRPGSTLDLERRLKKLEAEVFNEPRAKSVKSPTAKYRTKKRSR
jgi:hypothetical protein